MQHEFVNSDPMKFDSNCSVCDGKQRDSIHKSPEELAAWWNEVLGVK